MQTRSSLFIPTLVALLSAGCILASPGRSLAQAAPVGDPVLDPPTILSLGVYWIVKDEDARPASVRVEYRKNGAGRWMEGPPLFRAQSGPFKGEGGQPKPLAVSLPEGAHLFAGSVLMLQPDTAYQLRLTLNPGQPGSVQKLLNARTIGEPVAPAGMRVRYVAPGAGGGAGTKADPFRGLAAADATARPGDLFLLRPGSYTAPVRLHSSGEQGHPIIWRGPEDDSAIIDGKMPLDKLSDAVLDAVGLHDVWFEHLSICHCYNGIRAHESTRIVVRRCHFYGVIGGVFAAKDDTDRVGGFYIADNLFEGIMPWPATDQQWHDLPESRGIWITGRQNVVCYNRIHNFKDGMDLDDCRACVSNDLYGNDISQMFDDGSEMDGSDRNTRNFLNRYTNVLCGISFQPVYGGPIYAFRNQIYNIRNEPFKLHNSPSGVILVHNTTLRSGAPLQLNTSDPIHNIYMRNNLIVGTKGRAFDCTPLADGCDLDYDGFAGWSGPVFFKWNNVRYPTPAAFQAGSGIEKHMVVLDPANLFASGLQAPSSELTVFDPDRIDARLKPGSLAIGAGQFLPGFDTGSPTVRPDLGALPFGAPLPHYGPRP